MKKHFVEFYSPGTFVAEINTKEIDSWDVDKAMEMARKIKQRYSATPYGFRFITRGRKPNELDSKIIDKSPMYYLGGEVLTVSQVKKKYPKEKILISNMEVNNWEKIIINRNSWQWTQPLNKSDIVLDFVA